MKIWLRRIIVLVLISLGIAMTFLPFNDTRSGTVELEVVYLQKEQLLNSYEIKTQFPGIDIQDITGPELNSDDYPDLWEIFINLGSDWENESGQLEDWTRFQKLNLSDTLNSWLVVFREKLIYCTIDGDRLEDSRQIASYTYLGRFNPNIKDISETEIASYPTINSAIAGFDTVDEMELSPIAISIDEWNGMIERYLDPVLDSQTFHYDGHYYGPEFSFDYLAKEGRIKWLLIVLRIIGIGLILIGVVLTRRLYFRKHGIMVNPRGIAILYDLITLILGVPSAYMAVSTVLTKILYIPPIINDDFGIFIGIFFLCIGIPVMSLFTSRFTSQSVEIDVDGISVDSYNEKDSISWESLESIDFSDEYVLVGRVGVLIPRQLQKRLKLKSKTGQKLIINEPQIKSVKEQIASRFERYAPEHLKDKLKKILVKW